MYRFLRLFDDKRIACTKIPIYHDIDIIIVAALLAMHPLMGLGPAFGIKPGNVAFDVHSGFQENMHIVSMGCTTIQILPKIRKEKLLL